MRSAKRHVRFTPKSGLVQCNSVCPLCANSGHCLIDYLISSCKKRCGYSEAENPSRLSIDDQF